MKSYFSVVKLMLTADKKLLVKCLFMVITFLGLEAVIPIYMQWMINQTEINKNTGHFVIYVMLFAFAYFILCCVDAFKMESYEYLGKHILWETRCKIYHVLWHGDYSSFIKEDREKFKYILTTETYQIYVVTVVYTFNIIINLLTVILFLVISFVIDSLVSIILLFSFFITLFLSFYTGKKILSTYEKFDDAKEQDTIIHNENVDMVEVVRTNGLMNYYLRKNKEALDMFIQTSAKSTRAEMFWTDIESSLHHVIYVLIAGVLVLVSDYSGGELVTVLFITNYLLEQSQSFQRQLQVLLKNIPVFKKVMKVAEQTIEIGCDVEKIDSILFQNVSLKYSEEREIFHSLNFELNRGDNVLIEGVNGAGKTSVLQMIVGLILPTEGSIQINGKNILEYNRQSLYKEICYVSQDELLLNETIEDYLRTIAHSNVSDDFILRLREKVRVNPAIKSISDNGKNLSGGEKKKLLIIKSLLKRECSIIILDEIDAGLDVETKVLLKELEQSFLADKSKIVIKVSHIDIDRSGYNKIIQM